MRFVMYNISQPFSANKIHKRLKQDMVNLSVNTIYNYLKFFENACLIYQVKREDLQGKRILKYDEKSVERSKIKELNSPKIVHSPA